MNAVQPAELTVGVEEEFMLADRVTGHLAPEGAAVRADTARPESNIQDEITRFQVESATPICTDAGELLSSLRTLRGELAASARARGLYLLASGTAVMDETRPPPLARKDRYYRIAKHFGALVDTVCGCHVHIAMPDPQLGVQVINHVRPWLPVLLALSANSPFWCGRDSGHASWRQLVWARWPSAGAPPFFESHEHYESSAAALIRSGAALDRRMIYWDIRLSEHQPTVEFRVCDVTGTAEEAMLLAVVIRALVASALEDIETGRPAPRVPHEVLRGAIWRAARDGVRGYCPDPESGTAQPTSTAIRRLVRRLSPALYARGELTLVTGLLRQVLANGGGACRQRAAYARRNSLRDVVEMLAVQTTSSLPSAGGNPTWPPGEEGPK